MKVLFLDIDGVLNCFTAGEKWTDRKDRVHMIHDDLVERLNRIIDATGCKIVLSSTWRHDSDWEATMLQAGIRDVFLGRTISLSNERWDWQHENPEASAIEFCERGKEIQAWVVQNERVTRYCILDDDSDMLPHQKHFKTDGLAGGLTEEIANKVIAYFNAP